MTNLKAKVIVTGGAGFIGSHIVDALIDLNYEVHIIDNLIAGKKENVNPRAFLHILDIREKEKLLEIFKDTEYVFHEAALPQVQFSIENPIESNDVNVNGLLNILEVCKISKVKKLIFASSCAVYGDQEILPLIETMKLNPLSPYAVQKYIGEIYCKLYSEIYNLKTVCLRYFNVYGERQSVNGSYPLVIARFLDLKRDGRSLTITGDGNNTRDYINVTDVVEANILAMESMNVGKGEIINIGTGRQFSVNEIARLIGGEVVYIEKRIEPRAIQADYTKAKDLLNWSPKISIEDGLQKLESN